MKNRPALGHAEHTKRKLACPEFMAASKNMKKQRRDKQRERQKEEARVVQWQTVLEYLRTLDFRLAAERLGLAPCRPRPKMQA